MKKLLSMICVFALIASLAACGTGSADSADGETNGTADTTSKKSDEKLVIWSFTDELDTAGDIDYFKSQYTAAGKEFEGAEVEFVAVSLQDGYMDKIMPALESGKGPDIFTGELDQIKIFMEAGYMADIETMMMDDPDVDFDAEKADVEAYIWESGVDPETNKLSALSWQVTPGAVFYKVDMAEAVWGSEDGFPVGGDNTAITNWVNENKFATIDNLLAAQKEVKAFNANWRLFADDQAVRHFAAGVDNPAKWVGEDGKLNAAKIKEQIPYISLVKEMYGETIEESLTANAGEWSGPWFAGMGKEFTDAEGVTWEVMAYSMPTWGLKYIIEPNMQKVNADGSDLDKPAEDADQATKDAYEAADFKGNWGMAVGPNSYFWGGTYVTVNVNTEIEDLAFAFVKSMLFDKERLAERQKADGDMYSIKSVMAPEIAGYEGRQSLGGMNHLEVFASEAAKISLANVTTYDRGLNDILGVHIGNYKTGADGYDTVSDTLSKFYQDVSVTFPEIYVDGLPTE